MSEVLNGHVIVKGECLPMPFGANSAAPGTTAFLNNTFFIENNNHFYDGTQNSSGGGINNSCQATQKFAQAVAATALGSTNATTANHMLFNNTHRQPQQLDPRLMMGMVDDSIRGVSLVGQQQTSSYFPSPGCYYPSTTMNNFGVGTANANIFQTVAASSSYTTALGATNDRNGKMPSTIANQQQQYYGGGSYLPLAAASLDLSFGGLMSAATMAFPMGTAAASNVTTSVNAFQAPLTMGFSTSFAQTPAAAPSSVPSATNNNAGGQFPPMQQQLQSAPTTSSLLTYPYSNTNQQQNNAPPSPTPRNPSSSSKNDTRKQHRPQQSSSNKITKTPRTKSERPKSIKSEPFPSSTWNSPGEFFAYSSFFQNHQNQQRQQQIPLFQQPDTNVGCGENSVGGDGNSASSGNSAVEGAGVGIGNSWYLNPMTNGFPQQPPIFNGSEKVYGSGNVAAPLPAAEFFNGVDEVIKGYMQPTGAHPEAARIYPSTMPFVPSEAAAALVAPGLLKMIDQKSNSKKRSFGPNTNNVRVRTLEKYREVYSDRLRLELEKEFRTNEFINAKRKTELSTQLELTERQVKIWFQNRRAKKRRDEKNEKMKSEMEALDPPPFKNPRISSNNNNTHHPYIR